MQARAQRRVERLRRLRMELGSGKPLEQSLGETTTEIL